MATNTRTTYIAYSVQDLQNAITTMVSGNNTYAKNKLIEMLAYMVYDSDNASKIFMEFYISGTLYEPIAVGTTVSIKFDKVGWLSVEDRTIIEEQKIGVVLEFMNYHGYRNYKVAFKEKVIELPHECLEANGII